MDTRTVTAVRIINLGAAYEAFVHMGDGSCRLINTDTLNKLLEEIKNCQVLEQK